MLALVSVLTLFVCAISAKVLQEFFNQRRFFTVFIICALFVWVIVPLFLIFMALAIYYFVSLPSEKDLTKRVYKKAAQWAAFIIYIFFLTPQ